MEGEKVKKKLFGHRGFTMEKILGKGAFATVFLCRRQFSRKKFAAKVINIGENQQVKVQTENEIEVLKALNQCQHIVRMCGLIRDDETVTCLLEYIPGPNFIDGILNWPRFSESDVVVIMKQLLSALAYCHDKRVIHRDINPENLLWYDVPTLRKPNTTPLLKVIDFNLARKMNANTAYIESDACGHQSYMAPETLQDYPRATFQTDIWSAGVLMFLILGGYPPFWNDNYNYLVENIMEANYALPDHLWNHASISAKDIITRALNEDMSKRPSATELLALKWFRNNHRGGTKQPQVIPSPARLRSFNSWLESEREKETHRRYTLTQMERVAYVPTDDVLGMNLAKEAIQEIQSSSILRKSKAIPTKHNLLKTSSIQSLVTKYERLSLNSEQNLFVY